MTTITEHAYNTGGSRERTRSALIVVALCFFALAADGYDLIVYGASVLQLIYEPGWDMTPSTAGAIGGWTLAGMMAGFLASGALTDQLGRRRVMMAGISWFSVCSLACAVAQSPESLGVARFLAGIGLGGVIPPAVVLTLEFARIGRRQFYNALVLTGFSVGGIAAAFAASVVMPNHSWRMLFAASGVFLLILPAMYFWLPESTHHLALRGRVDIARAVARQHRLQIHVLESEYDEHITDARGDDGTVRCGYRLLISRRFRMSALMFTFLCFCSQLVVYGLNTWLPEFMRDVGYEIGPALRFFLILQIGAMVGMIGGALLADKLNPKKVMVSCFLIGALSLVMLAWKLHAVMLMAAVAGAGLGTSGTTLLLYGYAAAQFPASCRATAVGASMGLGRFGSILGPLLGGWILSSNLGHAWNFYTFAVPLALGGFVLTFGDRRKPRIQ